MLLQVFGTGTRGIHIHMFRFVFTCLGSYLQRGGGGVRGRCARQRRRRDMCCVSPQPVSAGVYSHLHSKRQLGASVLAALLATNSPSEMRHVLLSRHRDICRKMPMHLAPFDTL